MATTHCFRLSKILFLLVGAQLLGASPVSAQSVVRFETYTEALDELLGLSGRGFSFPDPDGGTNCSLSQNAADLTVPSIPQVGPIGANLSTHCVGASNVSSGSVLGGSLVSAQPTRTVSQFGLRRRRSESPRRVAPDSSGFVAREYLIGDSFERWLFPVEKGVLAPVDIGALSVANNRPVGEVRIVDGHLSLFALFEHQRTNRKNTAFETGFDSRHSSGTLGFGYRITPGLVAGLSAYYKRTDGDYDARESSVVTDSGFTVTIPYQQACGQASGGDFNSDEFGGSAFAIARVSEAGFVAAELGGARFSRNYAQSLCLQSNQNAGFFDGDPPLAQQVFAGTLSASPRGHRFDAKLRAGYDFAVGPLLVGPRMGIDFSSTSIDAYSESEIGASGASALLFDGRPPNPTGAALAYDKQRIDSVQSRIGLVLTLPMESNRWFVAPFVDGTFVHEFANDQRNIEARFVEDGRASPTVFSFKSDDVDRNFFEVGGGVDAQFGDNFKLFARGKAIVGHKLSDGYSIEAGARLEF